jgi:hypothetical protein
MLCGTLCSFISTDEDPGLRIESFAVINLRGVSTNKTIIFYRHANIQRTYCVVICVQNIFKKDRLQHFILKKKALGPVEQPDPGRQLEIDTIIHN